MASRVGEGFLLVKKELLVGLEDTVRLNQKPLHLGQIGSVHQLLLQPGVGDGDSNLKEKARERLPYGEEEEEEEQES